MFKVSIYEEKSKTSGRSSLILVTNDGHANRTKKSLGLYFKTNGATLLDKQDKKDKKLLATLRANEEERRINSYGFLMPEEFKFSEDFVARAVSFIAQHPISERGRGKYTLALSNLKAFFGKSKILAYEMTEESLKRFARYLETKYNGETANNLFAKLKQIISIATDESYFRKNPATNISIKRRVFLTKEVLTNQELITLYNTPLANDEVRRSFLFSATCSGLRWCDVYELKWQDVHADHIRVIQRKTKGIVTIPLSEDARLILGERRNAESRVFALPSHTSALKWLRRWTEAAGITKHITYHCSRHTFGTLLISNDVNLSVTSRLMGHSSCKITEKYIRVNEQQKATAIGKLKSIINF